MKKTTFLIVGKHAVLEALKNPSRKIDRVFLTEDAQKKLNRENQSLNLFKKINVFYKSRRELDNLCGRDETAHQGLVAEVEQLEEITLKEFVIENEENNINFIALEEVYMLMLDIEMPQGFIDFMLSEPIILSLISVLIIAPIAEEFIFRGFLFSQLSRTRLGAWGALSISSFLWTIIHFQYEFKILLILFIFGIFLGYIRMAYNSLGLPIAIHAINNLVAFLVAYYYV